jgi:hypothetical protein
MSNLSPNVIADAIEKWAKVAGVTVRRAAGWNTRGRAWSHGIRGVVEHHWAGVGDGGLAWMEARNGAYPFCNAAIRRDGTIHILSALSAWGSGTGGPWPNAGVPVNQGHLYLWQNEFESWGRSQDFTDEMWKAQAAIDCALREVAGADSFPDFTRLINHRGWTDGGAELGLTYWLPTRGRKPDTLYDISVFRNNAEKLWQEVNGTKPDPAPSRKPRVRVSAVQPGNQNSKVLVVQKALAAEVGLNFASGPGVFGPRTRQAYSAWQRKINQPVTGVPTFNDLRPLGRKHGFRAVDR